MNTHSLAALTCAASVLLTACAFPTAEFGPTNYDSSGTVPCSRDGHDKVCGYRLINKGDGSSEIWLANFQHGAPFYRVLQYQNHHFTSRDGTRVTTQHHNSQWLVSLNRREETYQIPDSAL